MKHYRGPEGTKGFWHSHKLSDNRPLFGLIVFIFYWKLFCVAHQNMSSLGLRTNTKTCSLLNVSDQVDVSWLTSVESSRCSDGNLNQNVCLCFLPSSERSGRVRPKAAASTSFTDPPSGPVVVILALTPPTTRSCAWPVPHLHIRFFIFYVVVTLRKNTQRNPVPTKCSIVFLYHILCR